MLTPETLKKASEIVYKYILPTPQHFWPLLSERCGCSVVVKHENHTPVGAFKIRGGLVYLTNMKEHSQQFSGIIAATRGNHGQSLAFAAKALNLKATLVIPINNNPEKNNAMRSLGATLIEQGNDFQEAFETASSLAKKENLLMIPSFDRLLVEGVATYANELFTAYNDLDVVYVPIGLGSGICATASIRNLLGLKTKIVGVVTEKANAYALSFKEGKSISTETADTIADGLACRSPHPEALEYILNTVDHIVEVSEKEILQGIKYYFTDTHNISESAAGAALAALLKEKEQNIHKKVGLILTGGNIDRKSYLKALTIAL